jgi:hypothetical protein
VLTRRPDGRVDYSPEEGEIVVMRRRHACGSDRFAVTLAGLDVRLSCAGCGQRVILTRERLRGRVVDVAGRVTAPEGE